MQLFAFGINHVSAPLAVREQVVFNAENLVGALRELVDRRPVKEAAIISTSNNPMMGPSPSGICPLNEMPPDSSPPIKTGKIRFSCCSANGERPHETSCRRTGRL